MFPWKTATSEKLRVYATDRYSGTQRYDAIEYKSQEDFSIRQGVLQCLVEPNTRKASKQLFAIVRRLVLTETQNGNRRVVEEFGHKRFSYMIREDQLDVVLECIPSANIVRPLMLVHDHYEVGQRHGVAQILNSLPDAPEEQNVARFLMLLDTSTQYTTFMPKVC